MKLAEALLIRADQKKKLLSLRERITQNVRIQEGETPPEKVDDLIAQAFALLKEQQSLALQIDRANTQAKLADGRLLVDVLAERETLMQQHALLISAIAAAQKQSDRYSYREIKWVVQIKISAIQKHADDLSVNLRELNARIQETNWKVDI